MDGEFRRVEWIDGMKGIACIIVFLGHSVACIFPAIFFGDSYEIHNTLELLIHNSLFMIFFNSSNMVGLFLCLSGFLISSRTNNEKLGFTRIIKKGIYKYLKLLPMVFSSTLLCYLCMKAGLVKSIELAPVSYAGGYVNNYNSFTPLFWGGNGVVINAFIKSFITSNLYNNTLWFISVFFWGTILLEVTNDFITNKTIKVLCLSIVAFGMMKLGGVDWKIPFAGYIFLGSILFELLRNRRKTKSSIMWLMVVLGIYFIARGEYSGIYMPLSVFKGNEHYLNCLGYVLIISSTFLNEEIQELFNSKLLKQVSKYSFGIYSFQWPIIISLSCGVVLSMTNKSVPYDIAGIIGIVVGFALTLFTSYIFEKSFYFIWMKTVKKIK